MHTIKTYLFFLHLFIAIEFVAQNDTSMAHIKEGSYVPLYGPVNKQQVFVSSFDIDKYPVTNAQFLAFTNGYPNYSKSKIKGLFSEKNYLDYWESDTSFAPYHPNAPVTNVSWFAAKNYCECQGKRLPTMDEWEYVAMADEKNADARTKEEFNKYILSWYEKPKSFLNPIGSTFKNYWGVYDMHGLIWEWVDDFNSSFVTGESREDSSFNKDMFCGAGALSSNDKENYAAFMRFAFRSGLKGKSSVWNLGFRCVK